jgi:hypothetical protein
MVLDRHWRQKSSVVEKDRYWRSNERYAPIELIYMRKKAASTIILLLMLVAANAQRQIKCFVRGRVLDSAGNPVERAFVMLDDGPPTAWEDMTGYVEADADGRFSYETLCPVPRGKQTLYVTSPLSFDNYIPFLPPYRRNREINPTFIGQTVINNRRVSDINLGDVQIQTYYSKVIIHFQNQSGAPLFSKTNDWQLMWLRFRNARNEIVSEGGLSIDNINKAVQKSASAISMQLPEGTWWIEVNPDEDRGRWLKSDTSIIVQRSNSPMEVTLRMSKRKKSVR